jgi:hypothetical protein
VDGDFALRAAHTAGYWSGRTTITQSKPHTVEDYANSDLLAMGPDGWQGTWQQLDKMWEKTRTIEGGVFYFWGHSRETGMGNDKSYKKTEDWFAQFAHLPNTWYPTVGDFTVWLWERKNVQFTVEDKSPAKVLVKLSRPWLHPWLSARCPLSLKVPAGVEKVLWQDKEIAVTNALVELPWAQQDVK